MRPTIADMWHAAMGGLPVLDALAGELTAVERHLAGAGLADELKYGATHVVFYRVPGMERVVRKRKVVEE